MGLCDMVGLKFGLFVIAKFRKFCGTSDNVSGSDEDVVVSVEMSIGSLIKFGSPCVNECVVQYGSRDVWFVGLKGFSRTCSDVGVEPK